MSNERVLVIADEADVLEPVQFHLRRAGLGVLSAASGEEALALSASAGPDLVLLDVALPGMDGPALCQALRSRRRTRHTPIVVIATVGREAEVLASLDRGADDYVVKPLLPERFVPRCKVVLHRRREGVVAEPVLEVHELTIDPAGFVAKAAGRRLELTVSEFRLLHFLARHPGWTFTRYQLIDAVRGGDSLASERAIDLQVMGLRRKLVGHGHYVETVRGVGYRLKG